MTIQLCLGTRERGELGIFRELQTVPFVVGATNADRALRVLARELFTVDIASFESEHAVGCADSSPDGPAIEIGFLAIVRGTVLQRETERPPAKLFGVVDGFDIAPGQCGYGKHGDGFAVCAITNELGLGDHVFELFAVDDEDRLARIARLPFMVTPVCCAAGRADRFPGDRESGSRVDKSPTARFSRRAYLRSQ